MIGQSKFLGFVLILAIVAMASQARAAGTEVNLEDPNLTMASMASTEAALLCSEVGFGHCYQISRSSYGFQALEISDTVDLTRSLTASV